MPERAVKEERILCGITKFSFGVRERMLIGRSMSKCCAGREQGTQDWGNITCFTYKVAAYSQALSFALTICVYSAMFIQWCEINASHLSTLVPDLLRNRNQYRPMPTTTVQYQQACYISSSTITTFFPDSTARTEKDGGAEEVREGSARF